MNTISYVKCAKLKLKLWTKTNDMPGELNWISVDDMITYPIAKKVAVVCHEFEITPNNVTSFNVFLRIIIVFLFIEKKKKTALCLLIISHFLDSLDGTIARMYNQTSEFGKVLDSTTDRIFWVFICVVVFNQCLQTKHHDSLKIRWTLIVYLFTFLFANIISGFTKNYFFATFLESNVFLLVAIIYYYYLKF